jgi:hypothetical protein
MENERCSICGKDQGLLLHHISYVPEKTIVVCKSCHWNIHRKDKDPFYPAPKHCPLRTDSTTITDTCLINCQKDDDCPYSFRKKFPKCSHPGSNSELRKQRRLEGKCEWHAATCSGKITKCPECGFSYCDYHRHCLSDAEKQIYS